jgi:hypothetical protein
MIGISPEILRMEFPIALDHTPLHSGDDFPLPQCSFQEYVEVPAKIPQVGLQALRVLVPTPKDESPIAFHPGDLDQTDLLLPQLPIRIDLLLKRDPYKLSLCRIRPPMVAAGERSRSPRIGMADQRSSMAAHIEIRPNLPYSIPTYDDRIFPYPRGHILSTLSNLRLVSEKNPATRENLF